MNELIEEIRRMALDYRSIGREQAYKVFTSAADALESQAREIARLNAEAMYAAASYAAACEEIDRLKAQPSTGVDERASLETLDRFVTVVRECYHLASSYSGSLDGVDEHGGDDHEDPICAVFHRLYYAMFDGEKALEQARAQLAAPAGVPGGWRVMHCTASAPRPGDKWEVYSPNGSGGVVSTDDVKDWAVRELLDTLATSSATPTPAPTVEPAHSDVSVPRELAARIADPFTSTSNLIENLRDLRALLNGGRS